MTARELREIRPTVPVILYAGYADNLEAGRDRQ